jgi:hypothetical protein
MYYDSFPFLSLFYFKEEGGEGLKVSARGISHATAFIFFCLFWMINCRILEMIVGL